jgi:hypothetical protein
MFNKGDPTPDHLFWDFQKDEPPTKEEIQQALRTLSHEGPLSEPEVYCNDNCVWSLLPSCITRNPQADYFDWR